MSLRRSRRRQAGHLLVEALAGGALLLLALTALVSGDVASRRLLTQSIESLELERAATERLEYLRAQPTNAPAWREPSRGPVPGHPEWTWTITPALVEDGNVRGALTSFRYLRATLTVETPEGRTVQRQALRW